MVGLKHKMGIIGFGGMARIHCDCLSETKYGRAEVKGVFDINEKTKPAAVERGLIFYSSKEELLSDPEIDLITIATTNEAHKSLAIEAMRAGKNVLCEKPVTMNSEELLEIMATEKETGKIFTIDQNRRVNRDFINVKRTIENDLIGKPYVIESRTEGSRGMPKGWRTIKEFGGGMMLDWGVHLIDQLLCLIPEKVINVHCIMYHIQYQDVEDAFHLLLTFESGLIAIVEVGTNNFITHPRWYVCGKNGTLQINNWSHPGTITRCVDKENIWDEEIVYTAAGPTKTMAPRSAHSVETIELSYADDVVDDLTVVYDQFIDAVEGKKKLTITTSQALRVVKIMEAAFESSKQRKSIEVCV